MFQDFKLNNMNLKEKIKIRIEELNSMRKGVLNKFYTIGNMTSIKELDRDIASIDLTINELKQLLN